MALIASLCCFVRLVDGSSLSKWIGTPVGNCNIGLFRIRFSAAVKFDLYCVAKTEFQISEGFDLLLMNTYEGHLQFESGASVNDIDQSSLPDRDLLGLLRWIEVIIRPIIEIEG